MAAVRAAVRDLLASRIDDGALAAGHPAGLVLVACSGGADSVALASQVAFLSSRLAIRAGAVVVDHGLQPGSAATASAAAGLCARLGLDPVLVRAAATGGGDDHPAPARVRTETAARAARYRELDAARAETGATGIVLGHTLDDQAETVLLALARGSGIRSLAGMAPVRDGYWRPLLGVRRAQTLAACTDLGLAVLHDPTNDVDGPWRRADGGPVPRAAVRHRVLTELADALGRDPAPALARTARLARADSELLDSLAVAALRRCSHPDGGLDTAALAAEPDALRWRILRSAALAAGAVDGALSQQHVLALDALVTAWHGQGPVGLPGGLTMTRECGRLVPEQPGDHPRT